MEKIKVIKKVIKSINSLFEKDMWLIKNDLNERAIAHKLAEYLQLQFQRLNVDCEYNGDVDSERERKKIYLLTNELEEKKLLKESEDLESEITNRSVFPDIIIHKRGENKSNLCIIEMKKSTNSVSSAYDFLKLSAYTSNRYNNTLIYPLGIFIEIIIHKQNPMYWVCFFENGSEVENVDLKFLNDMDLTFLRR